MTTYRIGDIRPNPFRNIDRYPINREKVEALKGSIGRTDFWDNLVARATDGEPQIAYGHHRMVALREMFPPDHEIDLIVRDLDDAAMLHVMADENMQEWGHESSIAVETVRAVRDFLTVAGNGASEVTEFLGWPESRVIHAISIILAEERGEIAPEDTADLPLETATVLRRHVASIPDPIVKRQAIARVRDDLREGRIGKRGIPDVVREVREQADPPKVKPVVPSTVASGLYADIDNFWRVSVEVNGRKATRSDLIRLIAANRSTEELQGIALPWSEQIALALDEMAKTALTLAATLRADDAMEATE